MKINTLFFGVTADIVGKSNLIIDTEISATVAVFKNQLLGMYPQLKDNLSFAIAVNETYAEDVLVLKENDVVAIIPPVSGG